VDIIQSAVLGLVQGLGEFLPISSSAHLILVPWIMKWEDPGLTFDVALHLGTLVALLVYFRNDWADLAKKTVKWIAAHDKSDPNLKLGPFIVVATIPGAVMGYLLEKQAEETFRSPALIAATLSVMGLVLWYMDKKGQKKKAVEDLKFRDALLIGIAQGFALIPGVSRSGATISAGLGLGLTRAAAARFSFWMAMPITLGACVLKLRKLTSADLTPGFMTGVLVAAISGYLAIDVLFRYLRTRSYGIFAVYRVFVAAAVVAILVLRFR